MTSITPKVGDVVHVRGVVNQVLSDGIHLDGIWFALRDIVHVDPRPLKVGDRVRIGAGGARALVLAVDGDEAWLKSDVGNRATYRTSGLERVP